MKTFAKILGYEGLALLVFAILSFVFSREAIEFAATFFILSIIGIGIYLFADWTEIRERFNFRMAKYGTNAVVYSLVILGILGVANYMASKHFYKKDMTIAKVNSLSEQTISVLKTLDKPISVIGFFKAGESDNFKNLMDLYTYGSKNISYKIIDPDIHPEAIKKYEISQRGAIVVEYGARNTITMGQTEQEMTSAIVKVSKTLSGTIYFLQGHGEPDLESQQDTGYFIVKKALENENYPVKTLMFATVSDVPEDCILLVVAGPKKRLLDAELAAIERYIDKGGRLLAMIDPQEDGGFGPFFATKGVMLEDTIIVDQQVRLFEGAKLGIDPVASDYPPHEITKDFKEPTMFSVARSLRVVSTAPMGWSVQELVRTGPQSWGEKNIKALLKEGKVELDQDDRKGPLAVAVAISQNVGDNKDKKAARIVVVGDSDFANNRLIQAFYNANLFLNMIGWLTGQEYNVTIRSNTYGPSTVNLTESDRAKVFYASVFIMPQLVLMIGIGVLIKRRK